MKHCIAAVVVLATLVTTAVAQEPAPGREAERGAGRRGRGPSLSQMIETLNQQLNFDEEQLARINEIVAAHEESMQAIRAKWQELRTAMEAGDEQRAAELREQLRQQQGERGSGIQAVFDEIEPLLHEDQLEAFQQFRERLAERRGPGEREHMRQMLRELPDAVNMTEQQREKYDELVNQRQEAMRERMPERRPPGEGGDLERGERPGRPDFATMYDEFFEQVAQILNKDQLDLLADYRARFEAERRSGRQGADDVRTILSAAKRIRDLTSEQKKALDEIERNALGSYRELRRDREGQALLAADVKAEIVKLLDEKQAEEFKQNLDRLQSPGRRAERGARGQRDRERPGQDHPAPPPEP